MSDEIEPYLDRQLLENLRLGDFDQRLFESLRTEVERLRAELKALREQSDFTEKLARTLLSEAVARRHEYDDGFCNMRHEGHACGLCDVIEAAEAHLQ